MSEFRARYRGVDATAHTLGTSNKGWDPPFGYEICWEGCIDQGGG